jgi:hypothetical protein
MVALGVLTSAAKAAKESIVECTAESGAPPKMAAGSALGVRAEFRLEY